MILHIFLAGRSLFRNRRQLSGLWLFCLELVKLKGMLGFHSQLQSLMILADLKFFNRELLDLLSLLLDNPLLIVYSIIFYLWLLFWHFRVFLRGLNDSHLELL